MRCGSVQCVHLACARSREVEAGDMCVAVACHIYTEPGDDTPKSRQANCIHFRLFCFHDIKLELSDWLGIVEKQRRRRQRTGRMYRATEMP